LSAFAVAMLRVTALKIRKLSCTQNFLQLYALLFMSQIYLYLSQQKYYKTHSGGDDWEFQCHTENQQFAQSELNRVIRDLGLPKEKPEVLGSRLKEKNMLAARTSKRMQ
jgi:hypothetical protein